MPTSELHSRCSRFVLFFTAIAWFGSWHLGGCQARAEVVASAQSTSSSTRPATVEIKKTAQGFQLLRHGQPYFIKGVGGSTHFDLLKTTGANSVRTV